ncbi:hypothetical protein RSAG8_05372, partial [Rhizoctonia solani AG-8 WAC10335]
MHLFQPQPFVMTVARNGPPACEYHSRLGAPDTPGYAGLTSSLSGPPTNARSFLVTDSYGYGSHEASGEAFKKKVFNGIAEMKSRVPSMRFGFVDFAHLWDAVRGPTPGYAAFGYRSIGSCTLNSSTIEGACNDPDHTFYWIPNHPSKQTHRIMADYVEAALEKCH